MYRLCVAAFAWAGASSASSSSAPATVAATARTSAGPRSWASPSIALGLKVLLAGDCTGPPVLGHPPSFPPAAPGHRDDPAPHGARSRTPRAPPRLPRRGGGGGGAAIR